MAAGLLTDTSPSTLRPKGPAATVKFPPSVRLPPLENAVIAALELRMMTKSVTLANKVRERKRRKFQSYMLVSNMI